MLQEVYPAAKQLVQHGLRPCDAKTRQKPGALRLFSEHFFQMRMAGSIRERRLLHCSDAVWESRALGWSILVPGLGARSLYGGFPWFSWNRGTPNHPKINLLVLKPWNWGATILGKPHNNILGWWLGIGNQQLCFYKNKSILHQLTIHNWSCTTCLGWVKSM